MTKEEAIRFMIEEVEKIERDRLAENFAIDATKQKKGPVEAIIKALKEVKLDNEDQQD